MSIANIKRYAMRRINLKPVAQQTAKEKAQELADKYQSCEINFLEYAWVCPKGAKELALIAVDEILNLLKIDLTRDSATDEVVMYASSRILYWEEVKQEIENL